MFFFHHISFNAHFCGFRYPVNRLRQAALDRCPGAFISLSVLASCCLWCVALDNFAAGHWIFFAIDVDFVPSVGLYAALSANSEWLTSVAPSGSLFRCFMAFRSCFFHASSSCSKSLSPGVIVVPSFEADQNQNPPATKTELEECMSGKRCRGVLEVLHFNICSHNLLSCEQL
jgi:hypothetical protein